MKNLKSFNQFLTESYYTQNEELLEDINESDVDYLLETYTLLEEGWFKQIVGWTVLLPITLANTLRQLVMKKIKIKKMIEAEPDPAKKEKLRQSLRGISYEETKQTEKIADLKAKMKDQAEASKSTATPEEKEKYAKMKSKMADKLVKANAELRKVQGEFNGIV